MKNAGKRLQLSRRALLVDGSFLLAAAGLVPAALLSQDNGASSSAAISPVMLKLSTYMSEAKDRPLPDDVIEKAKQHVLDTVAAMISGSELAPGRTAIRFAQEFGGKPSATVVASGLVVDPMLAAMINGQLAHSDETDDSHAPSQSHPGCGVVPAALAACEYFSKNGTQFLRAVALGYDVGTRVTMTLGAEPYESSSHRSTHNISPTFGAAAAAASAADLTAQQMRWVLNYAAEQAGGLALWNRDPDHIEKGFDFAGGPARDGVMSALAVHSGWTGLDDVFSGPHNFFLDFNPKADPEGLIEQLGTRYEVAHTDIKYWTVGMPDQAVLDAIQIIRKEHPFTPDQVKEIRVRLAPSEAAIVDGAGMPDVSVQHVVATMVLDGTVSFKSAHDVARMKDPAILRERAKVKLIPDEDLGKLMPHRQSRVEIVLADGSTYGKLVDSVRGTEANPMTTDEVKSKARDLIAPVQGKEKTAKLIDRIFALESVNDMRELRPLLERTQLS